MVYTKTGSKAIKLAKDGKKL